ncbi:hypothetical protein I7I51_06238 [Histoplasma capsulatum]|uniref:Uncharacterized protein n=1 Tax=Ajellomyces capsulatus TaxID=5037 RepID=A0A8A1MHP3_AJECA|nr:hypothetical protein I7I51_06238 [Histoplasma capsulatum]
MTIQGFHGLSVVVGILGKRARDVKTPVKSGSSLPICDHEGQLQDSSTAENLHPPSILSGEKGCGWLFRFILLRFRKENLLWDLSRNVVSKTRIPILQHRCAPPIMLWKLKRHIFHLDVEEVVQGPDETLICPSMS